jgi:hypothetical protein
MFFFSHVHDRTDGTTYMGAYAIALDLSNKVSIVLIRTDQMPSIYSAWFICDHTDQIVAIDAITLSLKRSLDHGILSGCDLIADTNIKRWHRQVNYIKHDRHTCTIHVPRDVLLQSARGEFVKNGGLLTGQHSKNTSRPIRTSSSLLWKIIFRRAGILSFSSRRSSEMHTEGYAKLWGEFYSEIRFFFGNPDKCTEDNSIISELDGFVLFELLKSCRGED